MAGGVCDRSHSRQGQTVLYLRKIKARTRTCAEEPRVAFSRGQTPNPGMPRAMGAKLRSSYEDVKR